MNFELVLFLISLITGLIVLWDRVIGAPKRLSKGTSASPIRPSIVIEYSRAFFPVVLAVLILRSFIVEPFRIPSGSMLPNLYIGDFILVSKSQYGIRLPVLKTKVLDISLPDRGDVMVFRFPADPKTNFIKRVIGIPGDVITYQNKRLSINGKLIPIEQQETSDFLEEFYKDKSNMISFYEKFNERAFLVLNDNNRRSRSLRIVVPDGQYFVMGDNRDHSNDSRFWGFVPESHIIGKAFFIWFSWSSADNKGIQWSRIGTVIQ